MPTKAKKKPMKAAATTESMNSYIVKANKHHHDDGKVYHAGDIVRDSRPLHEMFKNKFDKVGVELRGRNLTAQERVAELERQLEEAKKEAEATEGMTAEDLESEVESETQPTNFDDKNYDRDPNMEETDEDFGDDVTEEFDGASDKGLKVYKQGRRYHITDADGNGLVDEPVTKADATKLVKDHGEGEEE